MKPRDWYQWTFTVITAVVGVGMIYNGPSPRTWTHSKWLWEVWYFDMAWYMPLWLGPFKKQVTDPCPLCSGTGRAPQVAVTAEDKAALARIARGDP
jgi:hypothetical protein